MTLGWFFTNHPRVGQILSHEGEFDGHPAALWLAPQVKTAVSVLANVGSDTARCRRVLHGICCSGVFANLHRGCE